MKSTLRIKVVANEHANMDSLPLRFGVHFSEDTEIELFDCKDLGPDEQIKERQHFEAKFRITPSASAQLGHFVLGDYYGTGDWTLVTVWRNKDHRDEFYLSETLKQLRKNGMLNPEKLLEMHPKYLKGQINSSAALVEHLAQTFGSKNTHALKESAKEAHATAARALAERDKLHEENLQIRRKEATTRATAEEAISIVESLEQKKALQEDENKRLLDELEQMRQALAAIQKAKESNIAQSVNQSPLDSHAKLVTRPWPSNKPKSAYMNIGIEAEVIDVKQRGSNIVLTYKDEHGRNQTVSDFGYERFVHEVFDYLRSCKNDSCRAVFILTYKPDMRMSLAADTMMWYKYRSLWQNT